MPRAAIPLVLAQILTSGCSSKSEPPRPEPSSGPPIGGAAGSDRAVEVPEAAPVRVDREPAGQPARTAPRAPRPIDIVLRSSPPGATAAVDGVPIGPTPTYWSGEANGREHEFTFVLSGYAFARYRFVPITSGVVHARLEVITDDPDAGVPAELMRVAPDAMPDAGPRTPPPGPSAPSTPSGAPVVPEAAPVAPQP